MALDVAQCRSITIILRAIQLLLGAIALGTVVALSTWLNVDGKKVTIMNDTRILSFIQCTSTYLTASFLLLIATVHRESFENMRKSIFELLYNIFGGIMHGLNSLVLLSVTSDLLAPSHGGFYTAGIMGLINSGSYFVCFFISLKARQAP